MALMDSVESCARGSHRCEWRTSPPIPQRWRRAPTPHGRSKITGSGERSLGRRAERAPCTEATTPPNVLLSSRLDRTPGECPTWDIFGEAFASTRLSFFVAAPSRHRRSPATWMHAWTRSEVESARAERATCTGGYDGAERATPVRVLTAHRGMSHVGHHRSGVRESTVVPYRCVTSRASTVTGQRGCAQGSHARSSRACEENASGADGLGG